LGYNISDKNLEALRERIAELTLCRDLDPDELEQVKMLMEMWTRRFLNACLKGRDVIWVDMTTGKKAKAIFTLDITLKNITVSNTKDSTVVGSCRVDDAGAKRAADAPEINNTAVWGDLNEYDRENGVCVYNTGEPWLVVEGNSAKVDEFIIAFTLLAGSSAVDRAPLRRAAPRSLHRATETEVSANTDVESYEFQAEVGKVMDIIVNSLYSNKDVFLRELVSNAADACDKKRFISLTESDAPPENMKLRIKSDKEARTLTIEDNGVGMTKNELQNNLGRIAQSGTKMFTEALGNGAAFSPAAQVASKGPLTAASVRFVTGSKGTKRWVSKASKAFW